MELDKKLNKIQQRIHHEFVCKGSVWADCPRQSGKTHILILIAHNEMVQGNHVFIKGMSRDHEAMLLSLLRKSFAQNWDRYKMFLVDEISAEVILYDEIYYDILQKQTQKKIVCLRTKVHPTLKFTYEDLDLKTRKHVRKLIPMMSKEQWELEFNNG